MFGVSCKGEITVSKHYPPDEVAQAILDALSGALAQIYERERAALDALIDAAEWIAANYENGDLNHIDFRLEVKHRVDAALTNFRGDTQ